VFEPTSRYAAIEAARLTDADGRVLAYVRRRFLPQGRALPVLVEVRVDPADRLDLIAARTLGDPERFWRICDANDAMRPDDLLVPGDSIRVPVIQA
jgi:nucleoid-associated protein YgaU